MDLWIWDHHVGQELSLHTPNAKGPKSNCLICQRHRGKKSTADTQFIRHMYLGIKCTGERFSVGRHRDLLGQPGLKPADCHSSARRLRAPSAACPFCQAAHALKPIPELKGELETSYPSSSFQAFLLYASTCAEQKAAKNSNWSHVTQGLCLTPLDRVQRMLSASLGQKIQGYGRIAQVRGMPGLSSGRSRKKKNSIK